MNDNYHGDEPEIDHLINERNRQKQEYEEDDIDE